MKQISTNKKYIWDILDICSLMLRQLEKKRKRVWRQYTY